MKSLGFYLLNLALVTMLVSCGKNNESGKSHNPYSNPYYSNQYGSINSTYQYGGISVNQVIQANPCTTSGVPNQARAQVQLLGVTSSGDVGLIVGQGSASALFVGYICQRGVMYNQGAQPTITDLAFGSYSQCSFKPITRATLLLPGANVPLYFRWLDGGSSLGQKFPFCR
jgi:hypothetical protein